MTRLGRWVDSRIRHLVQRMPAPIQHVPRRTRIVDVELSEPLLPIEAGGWTDAFVLVTMHRQVLGSVNLDLTPGSVLPRT